MLLGRLSLARGTSPPRARISLTMMQDVERYVDDSPHVCTCLCVFIRAYSMLFTQNEAVNDDLGEGKYEVRLAHAQYPRQKPEQTKMNTIKRHPTSALTTHMHAITVSSCHHRACSTARIGPLRTEFGTLSIHRRIQKQVMVVRATLTSARTFQWTQRTSSIPTTLLGASRKLR